MRTKLLRLLSALTFLAGVGATVLGCYALFIKSQAESLLKDVAALTVGSSAEADVRQLERSHKRFLFSEQCKDGTCFVTFKVGNKWLSALRLEPKAEFGADVIVQDGIVHGIEVWLLRYMPIFPTFGASAGDVWEYGEYPKYMSHMAHYDFPTPVGKPYLKVVLDSHASQRQRQRALDFSFRCLIKPGWGCDLPCDYLPLAWQDWKASLQGGPLWNDFNQDYPKSARCPER
jgi:hypothetical protein